MRVQLIADLRRCFSKPAQPSLFFLVGRFGHAAHLGKPPRSDARAASVQRLLDGTGIAPSEIDATVMRFIAAAKVAGASVAILTDSKIADQQAYGVRSQELPLE